MFPELVSALFLSETDWQPIDGDRSTDGGWRVTLSIAEPSVLKTTVTATAVAC